jgi:hypothetical protein
MNATVITEASPIMTVITGTSPVIIGTEKLSQNVLIATSMLHLDAYSSMIFAVVGPGRW